jgi:ribonuclease HI
MVDTTLLVAWRAWFARNEVTHDKQLPSVGSSKNFLCSYLKLIRDVKDKPTEALLKGKGPLVEPGILPAPIQVRKCPDKPWKKPPMDWVKLSVDGSFNASNKSARAGITLRDENGRPIVLACRSLEGCLEAIEAELRACVVGLEIAMQHSQLPIIVETDCAMLVDAVKADAPDRSPYFQWVHEIRNLANQISECVCKGGTNSG